MEPETYQNTISRRQWLRPQIDANLQTKLMKTTLQELRRLMSKSTNQQRNGWCKRVGWGKPQCRWRDVLSGRVNYMYEVHRIVGCQPKTNSVCDVLFRDQV